MLWRWHLAKRLESLSLLGEKLLVVVGDRAPTTHGAAPCGQGRGSRLFRRWPDSQHRAGGGAHHALRDAAHHQMAETGPTMGCHNDEVHLVRLGGLDDLAKWGAKGAYRFWGPRPPSRASSGP